MNDDDAVLSLALEMVLAKVHGHQIPSRHTGISCDLCDAAQPACDDSAGWFAYTKDYTHSSSGKFVGYGHVSVIICPKHNVSDGGVREELDRRIAQYDRPEVDAPRPR